MVLLAVKDVSKQFPAVQALRSVNLTVEAGQVQALVGENGAGKSTLVKIISGAQIPDSGQVLFNDVPFEEYSPSYAGKLGISVVYQRQQLVPWLSVAENILLGQLPRRFGLVNRAAMLRITRGLLDRLHVSIDPNAPFTRLSAAQQQEVVIARALYRKARLIILDEPSVALGPAQIERLFELVRDLCSQGVGVLYISHHLEEIFQLANQLTILRDGVVVATRTPQDITQSEVVDLMAGHHMAVAREASPVSPLPIEIAGEEQEPSLKEGAPLLAFHQLSADPILRNIEFTVPAGQVVGITGIVGSGTNDLARVLFGLLTPSEGQCLLEGRPYAPSRPAQAIARGVFLVPENAGRDGLIGLMPVARNITLVDLPAITRLGFLRLSDEARIAREYVTQLRINPPAIEREVRLLSGGNQQKVLLAKSLQAHARVLLLEEPTQGVDVNAKEEIHRIIRELAAAGKAVLVISTDIRDLLQFTDRMLVLRRGRIVADTPTQATNFTQILTLTLGTEGASWTQETA
ncbi:MAG TPA: sugar ABC transporter ATP-binding protein [Ktedonobacteraceae bacterium]|nr:sugar ABC transporter ATP-binding protein [Ktedonobacteraceae bacterium]HEV2659088.1 sugar ABC transporter ATP-binding protein [Ktedonobacteraceae bacterium]